MNVLRLHVKDIQHVSTQTVVITATVCQDGVVTSAWRTKIRVDTCPSRSVQAAGPRVPPRVRRLGLLGTSVTPLPRSPRILPVRLTIPVKWLPMGPAVSVIRPGRERMVETWPRTESLRRVWAPVALLYGAWSPLVTTGSVTVPRARVICPFQKFATRYKLVYCFLSSSNIWLMINWKIHKIF